MDIQLFFHNLSKLHPLSDDFKTYLESIIREELCIKNQVILSEGQIARRLWFIEKGFAMEYSYKGVNKKPYRFCNQGELLVNVSSFFRQVPSISYIELLEPGVLLGINYEQVQYMQSHFPETKVLIRYIIENYQNDAEKKAMQLLTLTPQERFLKLLQAFPFIQEKVSAENIAAYLGVSKKTLGRIRGRTNFPPENS